MLKVFYRLSDKSRFFPGYTWEKCFVNFVTNFNPDNMVIYADNCEPDTMHRLNELISQIKFEIKITNYGNALGFYKCAEEAKDTMQDNDIAYFVENDYIHRKNSKEAMEEFFNIIDPDYVTLYDHPDKYMNPIDGGNPFCSGMSEETRVYLGDNCHWKLTNSTTMTFASKVKTLREDEKIIRKWTSEKHPNDFQMFIELKQNFRRLASPIPGYSTHCETRWLTPLKNWNEEVSNIYN
jgi:hypothetical protein